MMSLSNRHNNDNRIVVQIIPFRFSKVTAFLVPKNALLIAKESDSFSRETSFSFQDGGIGRGHEHVPTMTNDYFLIMVRKTCTCANELRGTEKQKIWEAIYVCYWLSSAKNCKDHKHSIQEPVNSTSGSVTRALYHAKRCSLLPLFNFFIFCSKLGGWGLKPLLSPPSLTEGVE